MLCVCTYIRLPRSAVTYFSSLLLPRQGPSHYAQRSILCRGHKLCRLGDAKRSLQQTLQPMHPVMRLRNRCYPRHISSFVPIAAIAHTLDSTPLPPFALPLPSLRGGCAPRGARGRQRPRERPPEREEGRERAAASFHSPFLPPAPFSRPLMQSVGISPL